jgi:Ca2+-binding RTX toxin-like protein
MEQDMIQGLEGRVLLTAALADGTLSVQGDDGGDVIIVGLNKRFVNVVTVWENDQPTANVSVSAFTKIHIVTGAGDDKIWIDSALDPIAYSTLIETGDGNDMITSGAGKDVVDAGEGDDKVYTNGGEDVMAGRGGRDSIWAGAGNDDMDGGVGNDRINGEDGNDTIQGGKGNDAITGGAGDDRVDDVAGVDTIAGGDGRDSGFIYGTGVVMAGPGDDGFTAPGGAQLFGEDGNDTLVGSLVDGGAADDWIYGTEGADELHGGGGNDLIYGYGGNDSLIGDSGDDALYGGAGNDKLSGGDGNDNLYGTDGPDDLNKAADGHDTAFGDAGADWFETDYQWGRTDRTKYDRPVNGQNLLVLDPSVGKYASGSFYDSSAASGTLTFSGFTINAALAGLNKSAAA